MKRSTRALGVTSVLAGGFLAGYVVASIGVDDHDSTVRLAGHLTMLFFVLVWFGTMVKVMR